MNTIKCPQCGAAHVEHVSLNKYSCPYCGHEFYVENESNFVKQEIDEFKLAQQIKREEFKRKLKLEQKNKIIYLLAGCILFIPILFLVVWISIFIVDKFADKRLYFNDEYAEIEFLEAAPFVCDDETCEFSNFAQTAKINGVEQKVSLSFYQLYTNSDSTIAYVEIGDKKYERQIKNYDKKNI